jgi:hypothetical protein
VPEKESILTHQQQLLFSSSTARRINKCIKKIIQILMHFSFAGPASRLFK